jgi:hypothetical protein|tara:strand:+ start:270 stop:512 length:243 start_codon:yes stop_codon:yes gene_type:complete
MTTKLKVGDYGEMKPGEFKKNIGQYTTKNLESIINNSDEAIREIALDELERRKNEKKKGGLIDKPLGPGGKKKKKKKGKK